MYTYIIYIYVYIPPQKRAFCDRSSPPDAGEAATLYIYIHTPIIYIYIPAFCDRSSPPDAG